VASRYQLHRKRHIIGVKMVNATTLFLILVFCPIMLLLLMIPIEGDRYESQHDDRSLTSSN